jgi:hypothetical protein
MTAPYECRLELRFQIRTRKMNIVQNEECADGLALILLELEPGEQVVWAGRPSSVRPVVVQSIPKAIMGLVSMIFLLFWMVMVIHGGNNGWEKGRLADPEGQSREELCDRSSAVGYGDRPASQVGEHHLRIDAEQMVHGGNEVAG